VRHVPSIEVPFAGAASNHQGTGAHEARPDAPHGFETAFGKAADAAEQILIDDWIARTSPPLSTTR
jgi:hypothetical protein